MARGNQGGRTALEKYDTLLALLRELREGRDEEWTGRFDAFIAMVERVRKAEERKIS
jgi:hypothetical protein